MTLGVDNTGGQQKKDMEIPWKGGLPGQGHDLTSPTPRTCQMALLFPGRTSIEGPDF